MKKWLVYIIIGLVVALIAEYKQVEYANGKWKTAMANVKAYSDEMAATGKKNTALQLTVNQLEYFRDSVLQALDATRKELGVKDKSLKALQQVKSSFVRTDTIRVNQVDTLFREPSLALDTLIGDEWYSLRLGLHYPSTVVAKPEFRSEKHIVVSSRRETVNPPKRFFLLRWLQKKHTVLHVDVVEKNPYVDSESSKYIEIIR